MTAVNDEGVVVVCGGCSFHSILPEEKFLVLYPDIGVWQMVDVQPSPWYKESLMFNHTCHSINDGEVTVLFGGGNCFSFGTHFDPMVLRFKLLESSTLPPSHFVQGLITVSKE